MKEDVGHIDDEIVHFRTASLVTPETAVVANDEFANVAVGVDVQRPDSPG